ncbi:hypothetical protein SPRG_15988 [Saprolegnia parasitica CBS 223.65]|uniref:Uncharacterized protein n=1 Tax=Saprolegnia parasitica (strain CBS 223.65) TaxID=695850 RepID=A0A067BVV7_SAPPC|nr:hypothetical protein SPRG_15988 [Saprolegnia parasitica CBS 223.65]KDO18707.1 hypothetical protein SPRG_15988 [Saprolegnia parasitica CBS 223.65]|eukprot:XP_012210584.1 hypothetical protein SPRG_15988 [Saprolegnia parasitica CBS 223.65]
MRGETTTKRKSMLPEVRRRRLAYDREAKRVARQTYLCERDHLAATITRLTHQLYALRGTLLPWKEVAAALDSTRETTCNVNEDLRRQVTEYGTVAQQLHAWVAAMHPATGLGSASPWHAVTLSSDAYVRRVGFAWIGKQLRHAADAQLPPSLFPSQPTDDDVRIEWDMAGRRLIKQKVIRGRRQDVAKALWIVNGATASGLRGTPMDVEIVYRDGPDSDRLHYVQERYRGKLIHVLHKSVDEGDRTLSMFRTIACDALRPTPAPDETFQEWNEIRQLSPEACLLRSVCVLQPVAAYDSMAAYARSLFPDVYRAVAGSASPEILEACVERALRTRTLRQTEDYFANVTAVLESLVDPLTMQYQTRL